jgi:diaminohydroxyphosphoribosylaminopyrimidine deaminase/5-amino-6-(5-phosphoribosylamino)uracil reductase
MFTRRSLELAKLGVGLVSPNPLVGCLIVSRDGRVVGEGSYAYDGITHAEVIALEKAGIEAAGATAYVSLEPHSHHGKTAPCTDALIGAGIARVVTPIEDPNPLVSGRGFEKLREAGIEVSTGILADEAARLNEKFICWHRLRRPFVHLKLAMSLDGRISLNQSVSTALTGEKARHRVQDLRHEYDAILVGSNTAVVDDPHLTDRSGRPRRCPLVRVVLDSRLRLSPTSKLAVTARDVPTIVFTSTGNAARADKLREFGVDVVELGSGTRNLGVVLNCLKQREIQSILVEGGTEIAGAFCDERLVDKFTFMMAPLIIGGGDAPVVIGGDGAKSLASAFRLEKIELTQLNADIDISGYPSNDSR